MSATTQGTTRKRPASTSRMLKALAFLTPAAVMILIFVFYPVIRTVQLGFQNFNLFDQMNVGYNGLQNFRHIIHDPNFTRVLKNTFIWVFSVNINFGTNRFGFIAKKLKNADF
jgi:multiple sugar transport system permease protein